MTRSMLPHNSRNTPLRPKNPRCEDSRSPAIVGKALRHRRVLTSAAILGTILAQATSQAAVLRVPSEFTTIPTAIDSAAAGDTILVAPGTYDVNLDTAGKYLAFLSEAGPEDTILDGGQRGSVIRLFGGGIVEGFTVRNGLLNSGLAPDGAGIHVDGYSTAQEEAIVRDCVIEDNISYSWYDNGRGAGVYVGPKVDDFLLEGCLVRDNYAGLAGGGIDCSSHDSRIVANTFLRNGCHTVGGAIQGGVYVSGNLIVDNWSDYDGGGISSALVVENNTLVGNFSTNGSTWVTGILCSPEATVSRNIIAHSGGIAIAGGHCSCNNAWANAGGSYAGSDTTGGGNISVDPHFCDPDNSDYTLASVSPCRQDNPSGCGLIGAFGVGCQQTPISRTTWGSLKTRY